MWEIKATEGLRNPFGFNGQLREVLCLLQWCILVEELKAGLEEWVG